MSHKLNKRRQAKYKGTTPNPVGQIAVQPKLDSVAETLMKESNSH